MHLRQSRWKPESAFSDYRLHTRLLSSNKQGAHQHTMSQPTHKRTDTVMYIADTLATRRQRALALLSARSMRQGRGTPMVVALICSHKRKSSEH